MAELSDYEQFLKNVKRVRLTRAGLVKIMLENEQREAHKNAASHSEKTSDESGPEAAQPSDEPG